MLLRRLASPSVSSGTRAPVRTRTLPRAGLCLALGAAPFAQALADGVEERLQRRDFPSIFQAWSPVENVAGEGELDGAARHDLFWRTIAAYGLRWEEPFPGLGTRFDPDSVEAARELRSRLLARNPDMLLLVQLRYSDASRGHLPDDHPWWVRDDDGELVALYPNSYRLDIADPEFVARIAAQARALMDTGAVDGIMFDTWNEDENSAYATPEDRVALVRAVRAEIGEALIVVNSNAAEPTRSAPYVNGLFMEVGFEEDEPENWEKYRGIMDFAKGNLRQPAFTAFETWWDTSRRSPRDLRKMRATTALSLVGSDGFALFADPNPLDASDHLHDWYEAFWDVELGRPAGPAIDLVGGAVRRDYTGGVAVYSPPEGSTGTVEFDRTVRSVNTGEVAASHPIGAFDGDLFLHVDDGAGSGPDVGTEASVGDFAPPTRTGAGVRTVISVPYETDAAADLVVSLQDTSDGWRTAGFARTAVAAGAGTRRVTVDVAADAAPGDAYAWTAWLVPPGGGWEDRLDASTVYDGSVAPAGTAFDDALGALEPIGPLAPGERVEVSVDYEAAGPRTVNLSLQDTATGWTTHGFSRADVSPGGGTATLTLAVDAAAAAGARYTLGAYLTPRGGRWDDRLDYVRRDDVTVRRASP